MANPEVGVAIIGYGIMGKAHAYAYRVAPTIRSLPCTPRVRVITGRHDEGVERAARAYDVPEWSTDLRTTIARDDIDIVDVCTPPGTHAEIVEAAAQAGKAILCEKPFTTTYAGGQRALASVRAAGVLNAIGFNYRRLPAVALMKDMIEGGAIGEIRLFRAIWLTDEFTDPLTPFDWRFDRRLGGTTVADLGSHLFDLGRWLVGDFDEVVAQSETFVRERPDAEGGAPVAVTVDDSSSVLVRFASGARGVFEMTRSCVRHPCDLTVEVNGASGSLRFDYARLNELWYGGQGDDPYLYGMRRIRAEHPTHPYAAQWWPLGQGVGFGSSFVNQVCDHLERWPDGPWTPDLGDGLKVQAICAAAERSVEERRWVAVAEIDYGTLT
jgi:predicted dehydrogenase